MPLRVCIPTAGTGSRLNELTKFLNKSLVEVANRPILSHQIEQFPLDTEFVIALGYKGNLVREFLELAYPERTFFFVHVFPYEGIGSGLGFSLLQCKPFLNQPFLFLSCDTLVKERINDFSSNWMAYDERSNMEAYRTIEIADDLVASICEKGCAINKNYKPYIGMANIVDYQAFWGAMERGGSAAIEMGESFGLRHLIDSEINAKKFTWYDTGNLRDLKKTREIYKKDGVDNPNILDKSNEAIWFVGNKVIKFSADKVFIANRIKRALLLKGFVPEIVGVKPNMYCYEKVEGKVLSEIPGTDLFKKLLEFSSKLWSSAVVDQQTKEDFHAQCLRFYKDKTYERVQLFYTNFNKADGTEKINGEAVPPLNDLLNAVDWQSLAKGRPGCFHGDFHFENILWSKKSHKFTFLDWRQDFSGSLLVGDIYYDFAKLLHGLIVCHELIVQNQFEVEWSDSEINFDFLRKQMLVECERDFEVWLTENKYDVSKVRTLTALIFLNIAALHHYPYSLLLYALGKSMLHQEIGKKYEIN